MIITYGHFLWTTSSSISFKLLLFAILGLAPQSRRAFSSFSPSFKDILLLQMRLTVSKSIVYPLLFLWLMLSFFDRSVLRMLYLFGIFGRVKISKIVSIGKISCIAVGCGWFWCIFISVGINWFIFKFLMPFVLESTILQAWTWVALFRDRFSINGSCLQIT